MSQLKPFPWNSLEYLMYSFLSFHRIGNQNDVEVLKIQLKRQRPLKLFQIFLTLERHGFISYTLLIALIICQYITLKMSDMMKLRSGQKRDRDIA